MLTILMIMALVPSSPTIAQEAPPDVREPEAQEDGGEPSSRDDAEAVEGDTADDRQDSEGDDGQPPADEQEVEALAAGPPVYEIEGSWLNPPATITRGDPVIGEFRVNVNDSGEPPSNDPVDNVVVEFGLTSAFFDEIPDLCLTADVDPPSSISDDGTVLTCNLGTVNMGTAVLIQTPVVANGETGDMVTHDGTIDGQTVELDPIPIQNAFDMDITWTGASNYRGAWDDIDNPNHVDIDLQWSLRLGSGSDPGPPKVTYRLNVQTQDGSPVQLGYHPTDVGQEHNWGDEGCTQFDLARADGHPWSHVPTHPRSTNFVDSCELTQVPNQPGVFDLTLDGINYDLLNVPEQDSFGNLLPPDWDYVASGSLWFRVLTDNAGSISLTSSAPTYTAPSGQTSADLPGNNTTNKPYTLPGSWSAAYLRSFTGNGGQRWDDTYRVSAGTTVQQYASANFPADNVAPGASYGVCSVLDTAFVEFDPTVPIEYWINPREGGGEQLDQAPGTVEYYTGNTGDPDQFRCDTGTWSETPPADPADVTAVRMTFPHSTYSDLDAIGIQFRVPTKIDENVDIGQDIWMFGLALRNGTWAGPDTARVLTPTPGLRYPHTNGRRDLLRIILANPVIRKTAAEATVTPGVPADFTLSYAATGSGSIPDTVDDYEIVDTLPAGMSYELGSADPEPVVTMSGGQQVLTWTLDDVETNVFHDLTYQAVPDAGIEPGAQLTNTAVSSLAGETSGPARATVTTSTNGYTAILKTSDVEFIPNDLGDGVGTGSWTVQIESFDPLPQAFTDTIDILPYNEDQRGTSFSGSYSLDDVVLPDGGTVYYTDADPATLTDDPDDPSNGSAGDPTGNSVGWTTTAPDNPTAIRVIGGELAPGGTFSFQVVITTDGAEMGDVYVNRAQARAEHTELVMRTSAALVVTDYVVEKTSDPESGSTVEPGDTINYTITVTQQGPVPAGALLTDDMTDVTDDAVYNDDLAADLGNVELIDGVIHWDGILPVDGVATITYSVTVKDIPGLDAEGNTLLHNVVSSPGCLSPETCETTIDVGWYEYSKTSVAEPGSTVEVDEIITYTVEITQRGEGAVADAWVEDDLSAVFDDAEWNNDLTVSSGEASLEGSTLSWSTELLEVGEVVTLTYSVTVGDEGDSELENVVTTDDEQGVCVPAPDENPDCRTNHRLGDFTVEKTSDPVDGSDIEEGDVVTYTVTVTHVGAASVEASFDDDTSKVLDDALWNYDLQASAGEASFDEPTLSWDGVLFPGDEVTVTYSVTATEGGDRRLVNVVTTPGVCVPVDGQDQACVTQHALPEVTPIADSAPPHGDPDWLPRTGASLLWIVAAGLLVLLGGAGLLQVGRRRGRRGDPQH